MARAVTSSCSIKCTVCGNSAAFKNDPPVSFYDVDCDISGDEYIGEPYPICSSCWNRDCLVVYYHDENNEVYDECSFDEIYRNKVEYSVEPDYDYYD